MTRRRLDAGPGPGTGRAAPLVGIGASAGGLESLEILFANVPADLGMAYVVIQHLSSTHRSMMPELLRRVTGMPVDVAVQGAAVRPDTITLIPPGQFLTVVGGRFRLEPKPVPPTLTLPIDRFFESMAEEWGDGSVAVVLSGTGSDGTRGAARVQAAGGLVLAEDPTAAQFDGMPRSAIDANTVDIVLPADEIGRYLTRFAAGSGVHTAPPPAGPDTGGDTLRLIAELLQRDTGVDFERYKRATVGRRVARRMAAHGLASAEEYLALLRADATEREVLYRELLIRVTSFFRDADVWAAFTELVVAPVVAAAPAHEALRMWVPACSTGEEAYTLAMIVLDEIRRQERPVDLKVFATDIDREGLELAARGQYRDSQMAGVDDERRDRYFARIDGRQTVTAELRRRVMFAHHNVTRDAPFTRLDAISCRNLFIYLDQDLQRSVLGAFHFALKPGAALLLGTSESLGEHADRFAAVDGARKLFRSTGERRGTAWVADFRQPAVVGAAVTAGPGIRSFPERPGGRAGAVAELALRHLVDRFAPPAVLVDDAGAVRHVFGDVSPYLRVAAGSPTMQVLEMCREDIAVPLAAGIPRALRTGDDVVFPTTVRDPDGRTAGVEVAVSVVDHGSDVSAHVLVTFRRSEVAAQLAPPPGDPVRLQLAELNDELRRARRAQQQLVEQLEGSNEELQATNEEMVAANEELQAANEELQSVNEELFTVNAENTRRIHELEVLRHDLDHLLTATDVGTLVVDDQRIIRRFTRSVSEFLPILERDIGRPIAHLANSLGGDDFLADLDRVILTQATCERSIDSIHGPVLVRMIPYRMREMAGALVTFVDVSTVKRNFEVSRRVLDALPAHVAFLDRAGTVTMVNAAWESFAASNGGLPDRTGPGANYFDASGSSPDGLQVAAGIQSVLRGERSSFSHVYPCDGPDGGPHWYLLRCSPVGSDEAVVIHFDITSQKLAEEVLQGLATHDPLTGALNRRGIEAELDTMLRRSRRFGRQACALMLDCDDFKRVNDRLGHSSGDAVLRSVARRIEAMLRAGDTFARIGGDEFLVLLPEATLDAANVAAERVRLAVAGEPIPVGDETVELTVSMAVVEVDGHVFTLEHLLERCRDGLAASKHHGKNRVTATAPPVSGDLRASLAALIERNQLGVAVQPIVSVADASVVGAELLTRSTAVPALPVATILRAAAQEGMLAAVDEHLLEQCLQAGLRLPHPGRRHVNLFPSTLLTLAPARVDTLFGGVSSVEHPVVVELSERQLAGDPADLLPALRHLRNHGVEIALDDVGFGRTSLETLLIVEPHIVKVDPTCLRGVDQDAVRRRWLRRLVTVARSLGATVVAEGVEFESELAVVVDLGVEWCQGYLFAEPVLLG